MPIGIYPRTEGHKKKLSESHKGQISWNKGKHSSDETKILISKKKKEYYKKHPEEADRHAKILQEHNKKNPRKGKKHPMYGKTKEEVPNWKGGRTINGGHIYIFTPEHPYATQTGYVQESRLVMEKVLGRYLRSAPEEIVHHKNGNPLDNRSENLEVISQSKHVTLHFGKGENNPGWKGGKFKQNGVLFVKAPEDHPYACKGYIQEHRLVMEQHLGRYLEPFPQEKVMHLNKIKNDNRIENLELKGL